MRQFLIKLVNLIWAIFHHPAGASVVMLVWGLWVVAFNSFDTTPTFDIMEKFATERTWGGLMVCAASLRLVVFILDYSGFRKWGPFLYYLVIVSSAAVAWMWGLAAIALTVANWRSTATPIYALFLFPMALADFLAVLGVRFHLLRRYDDGTI